MFNRFSRLGLFVCLLFFAAANVAGADPIEFVRIEGLAEQIVGEKLLREIYKRAGFEITIEALPGTLALAQSSVGRKAGETLRIYGLGENINTLVRVPTPLSSLHTTAFAKKGHSIKLNSWKDLSRYRVAIVSGVLHTMTSFKQAKSVMVVPGTMQLFPPVQEGHVDLALSSRINGLSALKKLGVTDIEPIEPSLRTLELYHYIHVSRADDLVPKIDAIIRQMTDSGELAHLRAKFEKDYLDSL